MKSLRNHIIHDYEGVNLKLIWEIIDEDIKNIKRTVIETNWIVLIYDCMNTMSVTISDVHLFCTNDTED